MSDTPINTYQQFQKYLKGRRKRVLSNKYY